MSDAHTFLDTLYGAADPNGFVLVSTHNGNGWREGVGTYRVSDLGQLAARAPGSSTGDVYLTVLPRSDDKGRSNGNTAELSCLWLELDQLTSSDAKQGADPATYFTDYEEVCEFLAEVFPWGASMIVSSGHGWHVYFVFDEPMPWGEEASALLASFAAYAEHRAKSFGKRIDSVFDPARVMRLPGTTNHKNPHDPRPVSLIESNTLRHSPAEILDAIPAGCRRVGRHYSELAEVTDVGKQLAEWDEDKIWTAEGRHYVDALVAEIDPGSRHPTFTSALASLIQPNRRGVVLSEAVEVLRDRFIELKPGAEAEADSLIRYFAAARLAEVESEALEVAEEGPGRPFSHSLDDIGNSTRLVEISDGELRFIPMWGRWLYWAGHFWIIDYHNVQVVEMGKGLSSHLYREAADQIDSNARDSLAKWANSSASRHRIEAAVRLARGVPGIPIEHTDLDTDPNLFATLNGVIDLTTGRHRPGRPEDLMYRHAGVAYKSNATAPTWERCMVEWFPDPETRRYVQKLAGLGMIGNQREHLLIIHYGDGRNGKGTFTRGLQHVMGDYFVTPDHSLIVQSKYEKHDTEKAALFRTRLAVLVETDRRVKLNESSVKNLTGGDTIHARRLYENPWEFKPSHLLMMQTNHLPEISGTDTGVWERIRVVPWQAAFTGENQDVSLDERLRAEGSGILNWMIEGCLLYQAEGLNTPDLVRLQSEQYRAEEDVLGRWAADNDVTFGLPETEWVPASEVTESLRQWCKSEGVDQPDSRAVSGWLSAKGAVAGRKRRDGRQVRCWSKMAHDPPRQSLLGDGF